MLIRPNARDLLPPQLVKSAPTGSDRLDVPFLSSQSFVG
ncbi:hypothetical protein T11_11864 [Trichinella zimbabwensis]|uniref:Uncharacterized protein n=1 Tax=Trichinella zimbabwensis TaxID=268475 RepID=A0A0V1GLE0_9BILA|nr:hypothetical protein T11_11864 [Trichinella zimbabwensis]